METQAMVAKRVETEDIEKQNPDSVEEAADFYHPLASWEPIESYPHMAETRSGPVPPSLLRIYLPR